MAWKSKGVIRDTHTYPNDNFIFVNLCKLLCKLLGLFDQIIQNDLIKNTFHKDENKIKGYIYLYNVLKDVVMPKTFQDVNLKFRY